MADDALPDDLVTDEMAAAFADDTEQVERLRSSLLIQGQVITHLQDLAATADELIRIQKRQLAAASEYIGWLERQLDARLLAEANAG